MTTIYVDADACPVKEEAAKVAARHGLAIHFVSNAFMRLPEGENVHRVVVPDGPDVADDWIAERITSSDIAVTADIPLASRCIKEGAHVIGTTGKPFTENNIGSALATRDLLSELRGAGEITGGPPPLEKRDRSRFLQTLDEVIQSVRRKRPYNST